MAAQTGERAAPPPLARSRRRGGPSARPTVLLLALAAISLMLVDVRGGATVQLRAVAAALGGPVQEWADATIGAVRVVPQGRQDAAAAQQEAAELRLRNNELTLQVDRLEQQLRADAGGDALPTPLRTLPATVVAAGPGYGRTTLTLDVGSSDGVAEDTAVIAGGAVVGRILLAGPTTSTVQLITDPDSRVAVRLRGSRETALAAGTADPNSITLQLFDALVDVVPGERVVTVGSPNGRPFPAGLTIGTVSGVSGSVGSLQRTVRMQPAADVTALDRVLVLLPTGDAARASGAVQ